MCGRYASARKRAELLAEFRVERDRVTESLQPDYNVAPTKPVYAVLERGARGSGGSGDGRSGGSSDGRSGGSSSGDGSGTARQAAGSGDGAAAGRGAAAEQAEPAARELRVVRWGLVPSWAKDASIGSRLINARVETADSKPSFRRAFTRRRCLLPADGFYEWIPVPGPPKARKQPYYIHRADGEGLAFAGLYELWRDRSYPDDHPRAWLWTAVIITTRAEDEIGHIHERMPMVIAPDQWQEWLDPANNDPSDVRALLAPAVAGGLTSYPVSMAVNSVRNNGPRLIEPEPSSTATGGSL